MVSPARNSTHLLNSDGTEGVGDIYAMNTDGSGLTRLTDDPAEDSSPPGGRCNSADMFSVFTEPPKGIVRTEIAEIRHYVSEGRRSAGGRAGGASCGPSGPPRPRVGGRPRSTTHGCYRASSSLARAFLA